MLRNDPMDWFTKMTEAPYEYVGDAILIYSFTEWNHVRSNYTDVHPGGHKCKLRLRLSDVGMTKEQLDRCAALAGPRYHGGSKILTLVSRKFLNVIQNRIYCRILLDKLLVASGVVFPKKAKKSESMPDIDPYLSKIEAEDEDMGAFRSNLQEENETETVKTITNDQKNSIDDLLNSVMEGESTEP